MRRAIVAISVVLSLGVMPAAADDSVAPPADPQWAQPDASVSQDAATLVEQAGDSGAMTIVYAVQDGDSLVIETEQAPTPAQAEQTIADVQQQSDVVAVDVDAPRRLTSLPSKPLALDPSRGEQWALDMLKAEQAWDYSEGAGVVVAVLDSGVSRHQDLAGSFVRGVDMVDGLDPRMDDNGHGTHVAGIMAMSANNAEGGTGLAPQVSIMSVKVADSSGWVSAADSARGIIWAVDKGADVLNMSYSGSASSVEQKAIEYALSKGVLPVAAVGNAYLDSGGSLYNPIQYPAAYKGVVGVGAVTRSLTRSSFSEVGKQVDLVAPGGSGMFNSQKGIFSTFADGRYVRMPGTSMATPYVSATAALAIARQRSLGISVPAPDLLMGTAVDLGPAGRDDEFGFGLVDPVAALAKLTAIASTGAALPIVDPSEVQTRMVHRITLRARPGILRYRIPATGEFVVAIQRVKNKKWSKPTKFKGLRNGRTWYTLTAPPGLKVRIIAVRNDALGKNDPVWVSPAMRTRGKR